MIREILVLGGGSAGFLAAITLRIKHPQLKVRLLRSPDIGIIGVGEGTTRALLTHMHGVLRIDLAEFYREVRPIWKLGIRFLWGTRPYFNFTFTPQFDSQVRGLRRPNGFYANDEIEHTDVASSLMTHDRVFLKQQDGGPLIRHELGYHLENEVFVNYLDRLAAALGIEILDGTVEHVTQNDAGIEALQLQDGRTLSADLYVDCSGFRSLLLGKTLQEPFESYKNSLYCDSAVAGGWQRPDGERIKPYTTAETMNSGWCWQIEHEHRINRGYVYSSAFISDDEAEREFREKNPRIDKTRIVRFTTGRYRRAWVKNVVAIGNAAGFVEPLEATALGVIAEDCQAINLSLTDCAYEPTASLRQAYNNRCQRIWDAIRNFLAIHYRFNRRLDTPFWRECRESADLAGAQHIVDYYRENGPAVAYRELLVDAADQFRLEGYWALLVGQQVPFEQRTSITPEERQIWRQHQVQNSQRANEGFTVEQALAVVHSAHWSWSPDFYRLAGG